MEAGEITLEDGKYYIILEIINNKITKTMLLEEYIMKSIAVYFDGKLKTIEEIVNQQYWMHINNSVIHEK